MGGIAMGGVKNTSLSHQKNLFLSTYNCICLTKQKIKLRTQNPAFKKLSRFFCKTVA